MTRGHVIRHTTFWTTMASDSNNKYCTCINLLSFIDQSKYQKWPFRSFENQQTLTQTSWNGQRVEINNKKLLWIMEVIMAWGMKIKHFGCDAMRCNPYLIEFTCFHAGHTCNRVSIVVCFELCVYVCFWLLFFFRCNWNSDVQGFVFLLLLLLLHYRVLTRDRAQSRLNQNQSGV